MLYEVVGGFIEIFPLSLCINRFNAKQDKQKRPQKPRKMHSNFFINRNLVLIKNKLSSLQSYLENIKRQVLDKADGNGNDVFISFSI